MRAEAQAHVDTINEALALLRRFLDWDRALRRLDELNARVEDQALWNDPKAAQDVMRERRRLDEAIGATRAIERELADTVELIELADAEGDNELASEGTRSLGEQAGIKSATLLLKGENAFGYAKTESGVHRLVRISPYDSSARRHTSFSSVWVYPVIDDSIEVEINDSDLRIDTYRSSGAGGQHINTTDSAVRITHLPTGIVVQCQNQRSQHKNKAEAFNQLRARLYERELQEREAAANAQNASKTDIGWGHQIRSYVLQPYQLVKDLRTGVTSTSPSDVLDGDLDRFMAAALSQRVTGETVEVEDVE
jgi:peptide chain release factor 2